MSRNDPNGERFHSVMTTESGEELKLVGGLEVFNDDDNSRHLGNTKVAIVPKPIYHFSKKPPNPLKRLVGAQGLEPWTRYLKGSLLFF